MVQGKIVAAAIVGVALVAVAAYDARGASMALAAVIGAFAGVALYHAAFGFTAAWRKFTREKRGAGLRAQMLLIGLTCAVSFPLMVHGAAIGLPAQGNILPMGLASAVGALMFGVGMQMGGGCASGTLFTVGGGSTRMVLVLVFFVLGSVVSSAFFDGWADWPAFNERRGVSIVNELGLWGALGVMAVALGLIALGSIWVERRAHGALEETRPTGSVLRGPWSLALGAIALAVVGIAVMATTGRPWGVTWGFALWGAQIFDALGVDVTNWTYWSGWRKGAVEAGPFADPTSVLNFGIVFGAMGAAALAGRWSPTLKISPRDAATAVAGGLLMGWGARMAYGCNIGAYLGGLVSGSLHGWWWLLWAWIGSMGGVWLRGLLAMDPPLARPAAA